LEILKKECFLSLQVLFHSILQTSLCHESRIRGIMMDLLTTLLRISFNQIFQISNVN